MSFVSSSGEHLHSYGVANGDVPRKQFVHEVADR